MKKSLCFFVAVLLSISACFGFTACSESSENTDNPISIGIPASELSDEEQEFYAKYIADYTKYIKSVICENIRKSGDWVTWNYTVIIDKFYIYDFSQVNLETLTEEEKYTFEQITNVIDNCQMIICCNGYWNFYSENTWIPSESSSRIPDMFISGNRFHQSYLQYLFAGYYAVNLPKETRVLDFGSKYAFRYQPSFEEAADFEPNYKTVKPIETI